MIYVLEGSMHIGEAACPAGTAVVLDGDSTVGPLVAGDEGTVLLEVFHGAGSWSAEPNEQCERLVRERRIRELPGAGRESSR